MIWNNSLYGNFRTPKFREVFTNSADFIQEYKDSGLAPNNNKISDSSAEVLFGLLFATYGNSNIASSDTDQFKYQVWKTIYEFGPTWEKRIDIQNNLRSLTDTQLEAGDRNIYNRALNPSTTPTTEELDYISEQTVTKTKKSKLSQYAILDELLKTDVTARFLSNFKKLFIQVLQPELPLWYITKEDEQEEFQQ